MGAQRTSQLINLLRGQDPGQHLGDLDQRDALVVDALAAREARGTGLVATSPRTWRNPNSPETLESRRRSVRVDTPAYSSPTEITHISSSSGRAAARTLSAAEEGVRRRVSRAVGPAHQRPLPGDRRPPPGPQTGRTWPCARHFRRGAPGPAANRRSLPQALTMRWGRRAVRALSAGDPSHASCQCGDLSA